MPKTYVRAIWRDIQSPIGRFMALLIIIFLGVGFYVGVKAAGPSMVATADRYYHRTHLADITVLSTHGLNSDDLTYLKGKAPLVEGVKALTVNMEEPSASLNVMAFRKNQQLNQLVVKKGHLPKTAKEIVLDSSAEKRLGLQLGQKLHLLEEVHQTNNESGTDDNPGNDLVNDGQAEQVDKDPKTKDGLYLAENQFKIVGFVQSPEFIETVSRTLPQSKKHIDYFAYVGPGAIKGNLYSKVLLGSNCRESFESKAYQKAVDRLKKAVERGSKKRCAQRFEAIKEEGNEKIRKERARLSAAKSALAKGQSQIEAAKGELAQASLAFGGSLPAPLAEQAQVLKEKEKQFLTEKKLREEELQQGEELLQRQEKTLNKMSATKWYVLTRKANPGYAEFTDNADRISAIASVFPVFFFMVAALMSFTSMKRMVDDQRIQIGMCRGMGYTRAQVISKYAIYALLATGTGSLMGLVVGYPLFPPLIYGAYKTLYNIPDFQVVPSLWDTCLAVSFAFLSTVGAAVWISGRTLREVPAQLLRPKPPKKGQRILLERWTFLWRHISFNRKMTLRNLFRYKGRNVMTILGVAGSTALIVTGFGINDSISNLSHKQFREVLTYQGLVRLTDDASKGQQLQLEKTLKAEKGLEKIVPVYTQELTLKDGKGKEETASLIVPLTTNFKQVIHLRDRLTRQKISLSDQGVVATEKLNKLLKGQKAYRWVDGDRERQLPVKRVAENYLGHYLYLTPKGYQTYFKKTPRVNAYLLRYERQAVDKDWERDLMNRLSTLKGVSVYLSLASINRTFQEAIDGLKIITTVLVVSAGLLTFVVLFTLTQMNIDERRLELATIKVLGFYNREVSWYIFQELLILLGWGIVLGCGLGYGLNAFVLKTCEVNKMLFPPTVTWTSYLCSAGLTLAFATVVMAFMTRQLARVNMVEALKAED